MSWIGTEQMASQRELFGLMVEKSLVCLTQLCNEALLSHISLYKKQMRRLFVFSPSCHQDFKKENKPLFCCVTGSCSINFLCPQNTQLKALFFFMWHESNSTQTPQSTLSIPPQLSLFIFSVEAK